MPGEMPDKLEYRNIGQEKYEKISQTHAVRWTVRLWFSTCQIKCQIECHLECQNTWQICQIECHYLYIYISNNMSASNSYIMHMFVDGDHSK